MNTVSGTPIVCCTNEDITHDDIVSNTITNSGLITTLDLKATNHIDTATLTATGLINTASLTATGLIEAKDLNITNEIETQDLVSVNSSFDEHTYGHIPNTLINYNDPSATVLYTSSITTLNVWYLLEAGQPVPLPLYPIRKSDIKVGSIINLKASLVILDGVVGSPTVWNFRPYVGYSTPPWYFTVPAITSNTQQFINLEFEFICTATSGGGSGTCSFTYKSKIDYSHDNFNVNFTHNRSDSITANASGGIFPFRIQWRMLNNSTSKLYQRLTYTLTRR